MKTLLALLVIINVSCSSKQQSLTNQEDPFEILRLRIMERMAGNESSN